MAWTCNSDGGGSNATSGTDFGHTWATSAGDILLWAFAFDNTGTTTPSVSTIAKETGESNNWVKLGYVDSPTATSAAGVRAELWGIITTVAWSELTVASLSAAVNRRVDYAFVCTGGTLTTRTSGLPRAGVNGTGSATRTQTETGVLNGDLCIGVGVTESSTHVVTDTDTTNGSWTTQQIRTASGGSAANVAMNVQTKIPNADGTQSIDNSVSDGGVLLVVLRAAGGQTVTLGKPTETDSVSAITRLKSKTTGLGSETDSAHAITRVRPKAVGHVSETDSVAAISRLKSRTTGALTETDTAHAITVRTPNVPVGHVSEADTAHAISRVKTRTLGASSETDTVLPISRAKVRTLGVAATSDTAQTIGHTRTYTLGVISETDTTSALTRLKSRVLGLGSEIDTAHTITPAQDGGGTLGHPTETDSAHAITRTKTRTLGVVSETDATSALSRAKARTLGAITTTDTALAVTRTKVRGLGVVTTTDVANVLARLKRWVLGAPTETDTAHDVSAAGDGPTIEITASIDVAQHDADAEESPWAEVEIVSAQTARIEPTHWRADT